VNRETSGQKTCYSFHRRVMNFYGTKPKGGDNMIKTKTPKLYLYNIDTTSIPQTVHFGEHNYNKKTFLKYYKQNNKQIKTTMYFNSKEKIGTTYFTLFFPSSKFNTESDIYNYSSFTILFQNVQGRLMAFVDAE